MLARLLFLSERDLAQARNLTDQSLALLQEVGAPWYRAYPLVLLGELILQQGEQTQAREVFKEGLALFKEVGDQAGTTEALMGLASAATMQADFVAAHDLYQEIFPILQRIHYKELIPACLEGLAAVAAEQSELVWAAHLWGAAEALREAIGTPIPPVYRLAYERAVAKVRAQVGSETFAKAWAEGRTITPEQVVSTQS